MRVILIVGLPASGKTFLAQELKSEGSIVIDDPRSMTEFPSDCEELIITDPYLCTESVRNVAAEVLKQKYPEAEISWIFFENDPEQALKNSLSRPQKSVERFIQQFTTLYEIPQGADVRPVWGKNKGKVNA